MRHHPLYGMDYIIDILLVYRKYEGRKMTVQVRRHAYVRNTYTHLVCRENDLQSSILFLTSQPFLPMVKMATNQSKPSILIIQKMLRSSMTIKQLFQRTERSF